MEIKILETKWERSLSYRVKEEPYEKWFPLPWGEMELKDTRISGQMYSSRGGAWYWNLPESCIIGYGQYCPYVDFRFTGDIKVSSEKNGGEDFGWREGDRKWIHLSGQFSPSPIRFVEEWVKSYLPQMKREGLPYEQGSLKIWDLLWENGGPDLKNIEWLPSRRKVYNHQFFGHNHNGCKIFWMGDDMWMLYNPSKDGIYVVCPDHLNQPLIIYGEWYLLKHPHPESKVD